MTTRRDVLKFSAAAAAALASPFARTQAAWPSQPIKLLVAFPAGGPTDITMRVLADNAAKLLGQPVVVENKPGAGGTLPAHSCSRPSRTATRWRKFRWACSACRTRPRSTGIR